MTVEIKTWEYDTDKKIALYVSEGKVNAVVFFEKEKKQYCISHRDINIPSEIAQNILLMFAYSQDSYVRLTACYDEHNSLSYKLGIYLRLRGGGKKMVYFASAGMVTLGILALSIPGAGPALSSGLINAGIKTAVLQHQKGDEALDWDDAKSITLAAASGAVMGGAAQYANGLNASSNLVKGISNVCEAKKAIVVAKIGVTATGGAVSNMCAQEKMDLKTAGEGAVMAVFAAKISGSLDASASPQQTATEKIGATGLKNKLKNTVETIKTNAATHKKTLKTAAVVVVEEYFRKAFLDQKKDFLDEKKARQQGDQQVHRSEQDNIVLRQELKASRQTVVAVTEQANAAINRVEEGDQYTERLERQLAVASMRSNVRLLPLKNQQTQTDSESEIVLETDSESDMLLEPLSAAI